MIVASEAKIRSPYYYTDSGRIDLSGTRARLQGDGRFAATQQPFADLLTV